MTETHHIVFSGPVQGVFFRSTTKKLADRFGLKGFVSNLPNGSVELMVQGPATTVAKLENRLLMEFSCQIAHKEKLSCDPFDDFEIVR